MPCQEHPKLDCLWIPFSSLSARSYSTAIVQEHPSGVGLNLFHSNRYPVWQHFHGRQQANVLPYIPVRGSPRVISFFFSLSSTMALLATNLSSTLLSVSVEIPLCQPNLRRRSAFTSRTELHAPACK